MLHKSFNKERSSERFDWSLNAVCGACAHDAPSAEIIMNQQKNWWWWWWCADTTTSRIKPRRVGKNRVQPPPLSVDERTGETSRESGYSADNARYPDDQMDSRAPASLADTVLLWCVFHQWISFWFKYCNSVLICDE